MSVLLNHFKKNNKYNEIYCYTNIGYKNELYPYLLGFELSTICEPDYKWYKSGAIEEKILNESDKNRYDNDWFKLYDCGKKCFKLLLDKNE